MNSSSSTPVFSYQTRKENLKRMKEESFDLLVIGGGITGAGVAWDASSRGLKVALVEKDDFAQGTSSRSSKLVHGGLRYLENYEFGLVFEALSERHYLMKTAPHLVRPLSFYMPVYEDSPHSAYLLSAGMWFYDFLSLFRAPGLHQKISRGATIRTLPGIKEEGLYGSFRYYDASMWDDALVIETLMKAHSQDAVIASRVKAVKPIRNGASDPIQCFEVQDQLTGEVFPIRFKKLISCVGAWTDEVGQSIEGKDWKKWIAPSRGLHLVFDWKRFPLPGAVTMQISDGRIAFAIPRPDLGQGLTIVGTTDGPSSDRPDDIENEAEKIRQDSDYLLGLLSQYFPKLKLGVDDIVNHYIGIRPLVDPKKNQSGDPSQLQKVSREHTIEEGPGKSVFVAGGKYTTYRKMAEEIVDFAIRDGFEGCEIGVPKTEDPIFMPGTQSETQNARSQFRSLQIPEKLWERYGADAVYIFSIEKEIQAGGRKKMTLPDPEGFPFLEAQFRYAIRHQMALSVEDFIRRRVPLYLCRRDHGALYLLELNSVLDDELNHSLK